MAEKCRHKAGNVLVNYRYKKEEWVVYDCDSCNKFVLSKKVGLEKREPVTAITGKELMGYLMSVKGNPSNL